MIEGRCHCGNATWRFDGVPDEATVCNCTICRRYGAIWAYDWVGERIDARGKTRAYVRADQDGGIAFHFCPECGGVTWWRGTRAHKDGRTRIAVNLRLAEPAPVAAIPIRRFDGLDSWTDRPSEGRCVADVWA